jgi:hypothetical protein
MCNSWGTAHLFINDQKVCGTLLRRNTHHLNPRFLIIAQINGSVKSRLLRLPFFKAFKTGIKVWNFIHMRLLKRPKFDSPKDWKYTECGKGLNSCAFCFQNCCINLEVHKSKLHPNYTSLSTFWAKFNTHLLQQNTHCTKAAQKNNMHYDPAYFL